MDNREIKIWFTSDSHFSHNKEFLYGTRGFNTVEEMNTEIIKRWNAKVAPNDIVYHLGDIFLSDTETGLSAFKQLNGQFHIIRGNHDTDAKVELLKKCPNIIDIQWATMIKYKKIMFFLSHCPSITRTLDDSENKQGIINLYGHTHQTTNFYNDNPYMYHVGMDSHNLEPVELDKIIDEIKIKKTQLDNQ